MNGEKLSTGSSQADETSKATATHDPAKREKILQQFFHTLPADWELMTPEFQLHHLIVAADQILKPSGNWILVNGDMTLKALLGER